MNTFKFEFEYDQKQFGDALIPHNSIEEAEAELRQMYNDVENFKITLAEQVEGDVEVV